MPTIIPLNSNPSSIFDIDLDGRIITITTKYNTRGAGGNGTPYWTINLEEGDTPLALGLALVLGVDILRQLNLGIGSIVMFDNTESATEATDETLGTDVIAVYYTEAERLELENGSTI